MMRTYSRKRPHNQLIEDVHHLCRLCLNKAEEVVPIFSEDIDNVCATLVLRIMICTGLEVSRDDCLPNFICNTCFDELNRYYTFRKQCEVTYQKLKSHVLAVKENQYKAKMELENEIRLSNTKLNIDEDMNFVISFDKTSDGNINLKEVPIVNLDRIQECRNMDSTKENDAQLDNGDKGQESDIPDPDISEFLSTMAVQLGILTQQEDGSMILDSSIRTMELETSDGRQIVFEITEEDEQTDINMEPKVTPPVRTVETKDVIGSPEHKDISIKYITSKYNRNVTANIGRHIIANDKKEDIWCHECGKRMATRSVLARHLRVHSGERPYDCSQCGRTFSQKEILARHKLVHEEERPFKCTSCPKSFTQRNALLSHARSHAPPASRALELHRCERCPKVFLYASGLSRHMMMHNGRLYVCGTCSRQFRDKSSLMRHLRNSNHGFKEPGP